METDAFSSVLTIFSRKILAWSISNSYHHIKEEQMLWLEVEYQNFENILRYKIDNGIYDPKSKRILPRNVKQRDISVHIHKNQKCVIWKKNRKDSLLNGVEEIDRNYKYV